MQKGRVLLTLLTFPLVTALLLITIYEAQSEKNNVSNQTLGVAHAKVKLVKKQKQIITLTPTSPPPPAPTVKPKTLIPTEQVKISPDLSPTDVILKEVNAYRASLGLSNVSPNSETCEFAKTRAAEISSLENFNHNGFTKRVNEKTLPYSSYSQVTENIAYNTDPTDVVDRWISSPGHAENMRKNTQFVCIGKYGDYYTYEGWQP